MSGAKTTLAGGPIEGAGHLAAIIEDEIWGDLDRDPLKHIFILTYEFDERQLLNLAGGVRDLLKPVNLTHKQYAALAKVRPLVVYDASKTRPSFELPQFAELHPYWSKAYCCHHSKAYCLVTEEKILLTLGSFNLTHTGLFKNREVLQHFIWDETRRSGRSLLDQWIKFLTDNYASRLKSSSASALTGLLETLSERASRLPNEPLPRETALIHSGYDSSGLRQLSDLWAAWFPNLQPKTLTAVSPFFDANTYSGCLGENLNRAFPSLEKISIFTDEKCEQILSKAHFGNPAQDHELFLIPAELSPAELKDIEKRARESGLNIKDQIFSRRLHAKMLIMQSGQHGVVYLGSGNFTRQAWENHNQELGVAFKFDNLSGVKENLANALYAGNKNCYIQLPDTVDGRTEQELDDESAAPKNYYPDFIEYIELQSNRNGTLRFRLEPRAGYECFPALRDYTVDWPTRSDKTTELCFKADLRSQDIEDEVWRIRLISGRNLRFTHNSSKETYWFPFQYDGQLVEDRTCLIWPSSGDWLLSFAGINDEPGGLADYTHNEDDGRDDDDSAAAPVQMDFRSQNPVIAMQAYLNLFAGFEKYIHQRLIDAAESGQAEAEKTGQALASSFGILLSLLVRERCEGQEAAFVFKVGELILLLKSLIDAKHIRKQWVSETMTIATKAVWAEASKAATNKELRNYIKFVLGRGAEDEKAN